MKKMKGKDEMIKSKLRSEIKKRSLKNYFNLDLEYLKTKLKKEVRSQRTLVMKIRRRKEEPPNGEEGTGEEVEGQWQL